MLNGTKKRLTPRVKAAVLSLVMVVLFVPPALANNSQRRSLKRIPNKGTTQTSTDRAGSGRAKYRTYGPLGNLLFGMTAKQMRARRPQIKKSAREIRQFRQALARQDTLRELKQFGRRWLNKRLPAFCRNELLKAIMNLADAGDKSAWQVATRFWEKSVAGYPEYRKDEIAREYYIVALNKSGRLVESIVEAKRYLREMTKGQYQIDAASLLTRRPPGLNGEQLAGLGKAYRLISGQARSGKLPTKLRQMLEQEMPALVRRQQRSSLSNKALAKASLKISTRYYEAGFLADYDYYPGINAVYNYYQLGNVTRAEQLAPLVWAATQRAGGKNAADYWCLATQVELALMLNKPRAFRELFPRMLSQAKVSWELSSTVDQMLTLAKLRESQGKDTGDLRFAIKHLNKRVAMLNSHKDRATRAKKAGVLDAERALQVTEDKNWLSSAKRAVTIRFGKPSPARKRGLRIAEAVRQRIGDFRSMTTADAIGGNVAFSGQIPDTTITRHTVRAGRRQLKRWGFDKITTIGEFDRRVNAKLNEIYDLQKKGSSIRPLEYYETRQHGRQDRFDRKRFKLAATEISKDSRTDLLAIMMLKTGDCRPTAYTKQLLFDVWRKAQIDGLMKSAYIAALGGNTQKRDTLFRRIERIERKQIGVMAVAIEEKNNEPHTLNVLVEHNRDGTIKAMRTADAFYRKRHLFERAKLEPSDILKKRGFTVVTAKRIYHLKLARYSGKLLKPFTVGSTDFRFAGQVIAPPILGLSKQKLRQTATDIAKLDL